MQPKKNDKNIKGRLPQPGTHGPLIFLFLFAGLCVVRCSAADTVLFPGKPDFDAGSYAKHNEVFRSYRAGRNFLNRNISVEPVTFYCGCKIIEIQKSGRSRNVVDVRSCGFENRSGKSNPNGYTALSREHIVPASRFGPDYCWNYKICRRSDGTPFGGRECCRQTDSRFRTMEADLINLRPAILSVNRDRRDFRFGEIQGEERVYGSCDFEIDFETDTVEPAVHLRGDIARTWFYFEQIYSMQLTIEESTLFTGWHKDDPVTEEEIKRARILSDAQSF